MPDIFAIKDTTINDTYLAQQVDSLKTAAWWKDHKLRISKFDTIYGGNLLGLVAEENSLDNEPYVENKVKNSAHDIKRLSKEARGYPVFFKEGEGEKDAVRAKERAAAIETIWEQGGGKRLEGQVYFDLVRGGFMALAVFKDPNSDYPVFMRLDPAFAYPTMAQGRLVNMFYVETMKENAASVLFDLEGLSSNAKNNRNVDVLLYFDKNVMLQAVVRESEGGTKRATIVSQWKHKLGTVPVAFRALDTADGQYRGLLDQLGGPLRARNRAVRLMIDYLEDMVHAPWEEKGIVNGPSKGNLPGPTTTYVHDEDAERETFIRRTPPAAPAAAVFGLVNYLDTQEQNEGFQPPSRVGQVRQSIASGSFVAQTQGSLSSVVLEVQDYMADLRRDANVIAMKIDEKYLNKSKPLMRAVGKKVVYTPRETFGGWYHHKVVFGAAAGLDRAQADQRVLMHLGAGLIDESIARDQIDYIESDTNVQDDVDRMLLRKVAFKKLIQDTRVSFSVIAKIEQELAKGKSRYEAIEAVMPEILEEEKQLREAGRTGALGGGPGPEATPLGSGEQAAALAGGAAPGSEIEDLSGFANPLALELIGS